MEETINKISDILNKEIFIEKVEDIIEVTYAYTESHYNKTLFYYFAWRKENQDINETIKITKEKLDKKIDILKLSIEELKSLNSKEANFILKSCKYAKSALIMAYEAIEIEAGKFTKTNKNTKQTREKLDVISQLDRKLFWWLVIENHKEINKAFEFISTFYFELWKKERWVIDNFIKKVEVITWEEYKVKRLTRKLSSRTEFKSSLSKEISQEKYIKIFQNIFRIMWINMKIKIDNRSSIYDWTHALYFPKHLKSLPQYTIISLIAHEIESHYVNMENWKKIFWKIQWGWKLEKEEGLAMYMEKLLEWWDALSPLAYYSYFRTLVWEICHTQEAEEILAIVRKYKQIKQPKDISLRPKRNYIIEEIWTQHKDITYSRGFDKVIDYISEWNNFLDLFLWRSDFSDINFFKEMKDKKEAEEEKFNLIKPIFLGEFLLFVILNWYRFNSQKVIREFWKHLKNKYHFIDRETQERLLELALIKYEWELKVTIKLLK